MKDNKVKERVYKGYKARLLTSLVTTPIVAIFVIVIMIMMIMMIHNGVTEKSVYLTLSLVIIICFLGFTFSLYMLNKVKKEDNNE